MKRIRKRKPGGGRKKLPPNEKRTIFFSLQISQNELDEIDFVAERMGLTRNDFIRKLIGIEKRREETFKKFKK